MRLDSLASKVFAVSLYIFAMLLAFGLAFPSVARTPLAMVVGVMAQLVVALIASCMDRLHAWVLAQATGMMSVACAAVSFLPNSFSNKLIFGMDVATYALGAVVWLVAILVGMGGCRLAMQNASAWWHKRFDATR